MSLLMSYSFGSFLGKDEIPPEVINLFHDSFKAGKTWKYSSEIIFAGMRGNIATDKPFHMEAYEHAIEANNNLGKAARRKKEYYIDYGSSDDYEDVARKGGISEEHLTVADAVDAFDEICNSDELEYAVSQIRHLNEELIVVEGVDLLRSIKLALKGLPKALEEVRAVCNFYPYIGEYIRVILSCGKPFEEVFA